MPSAPDLDAVAQDEAARAATAVASTQEAQVVDRYVKQQIVRLVAEQADPLMVIDVIDGMHPAIGALLSRATEAEVRAFLAADPILAEITRLPHFEPYLADLLAALHEDNSAAPPTVQ